MSSSSDRDSSSFEYFDPFDLLSFSSSEWLVVFGVDDYFYLFLSLRIYSSNTKTFFLVVSYSILYDFIFCADMFFSLPENETIYVSISLMSFYISYISTLSEGSVDYFLPE